MISTVLTKHNFIKFTLQGPVGAVRPGDPQYIPGVHGTHPDTDPKFKLLLYVPLGHRYCTPDTVPCGQYDPAGQAEGVTVFNPHTLPTGHCLHLQSRDPEQHINKRIKTRKNNAMLNTFIRTT